VDDSKLFLDLGTSGPGDTIVVRGSANGSIYLFQHKDMQDSGDRSKAEIAVFQVPVYEPPSQAMTVAVYAMRHKWGCSDTPWNPHVDAVRHLWSDGAGDAPQVLAIRHLWAEGMTVDEGTKKVVFSHAFDADMTHVRLSPHRMSLQNAMNVQVGVRADSGLPKDRWSSYQPVRPLYNERLPEPGQDIDVLLIVPDGEIVGPMALTGHAET